eukprot:2258938-Amphidinium_carterae.1
MVERQLLHPEEFSKNHTDQRNNWTNLRAHFLESSQLHLQALASYTRKPMHKNGKLHHNPPLI